MRFFFYHFSDNTNSETIEYCNFDGYFVCLFGGDFEIHGTLKINIEPHVWQNVYFFLCSFCCCWRNQKKKEHHQQPKGNQRFKCLSIYSLAYCNSYLELISQPVCFLRKKKTFFFPPLCIEDVFVWYLSLDFVCERDPNIIDLMLRLSIHSKSICYAFIRRRW